MTYLILATSPVLLLVAAAFFVLIVVQVRKRDHGDLAAPDRSRIDAIARRATGLGVRNGRKGDS